jgi:4-hydroxy-3-methylbut-2-enyl diphosphate reductase
VSLAVLAPLSVEALALRSGLRTARVIRTGAGRRRSHSAARDLLGSNDRALAVAGLCGGVGRSLAPGDVVVASELCSATGVRPIIGACALVDALGKLGVSAHLGPIRSEGHLVCGEERNRLRAAGALAVDMESFWLADAAGDRPFAVLRVVLDTPRWELLRPGIVVDSLRALATLRRVAPALETWAENQTY